MCRYQGNVGILDISTRNYTTVMRSHVGRVLSASVDPQRRHIATVSDDRTIRIWDFDTLQQVSLSSCLSYHLCYCFGYWIDGVKLQSWLLRGVQAMHCVSQVITVHFLKVKSYYICQKILNCWADMV